MTTTTAYQVTIEIIDDYRFAANTDRTCPVCIESDVTCSIEATQEGGIVVVRECCGGCLVAAIDSIDYLDITQPITVEACRNATVRPF